MKPNGFAGPSLIHFGGGVLFAASMLLAVAQPSLASQATARCSSLEQQLQAALKTHSGAKASKAAALGAEAKKLCANARPALGLRVYIKAFRIIDVDPVLPKD